MLIESISLSSLYLLDKIIEFAATWAFICGGDDDEEELDEEEQQAQTSGDTTMVPPSKQSQSTDVLYVVTAKMSQMKINQSSSPSTTPSPGLLSHLLLRAIKELKRHHEINTLNDIYVTKHELKPEKTYPFLIRKIYITPSSFLYEGPYTEEKCRVTRRFESEQDCFLRVSFRDESKQPLVSFFFLYFLE